MATETSIAELLANLLRAEPVRSALAEILSELQPAQPTPPAVLTSDELCDALRICRSKLDGLVAAGVPYIKVGSTRRYQLQEVLAWMRDRHEERAA